METQYTISFWLKVQRKYSEERAEEVCHWINDVLGEAVVNPSGKADEFFESLKDGMVLCRSVVAVSDLILWPLNRNRTSG